MDVNRDGDGEAFREAIKPVWEAFIADHGNALINAILSTSEE
ncbi:MAG TPA: hypothetical protein VIN77_06815 [Aurantimonas sp.]|nr:hypothetical protein [Aurantimonas marianensis]